MKSGTTILPSGFRFSAGETVMVLGKWEFICMHMALMVDDRARIVPEIYDS